MLVVEQPYQQTQLHMFSSGASLRERQTAISTKSFISLSFEHDPAIWFLADTDQDVQLGGCRLSKLSIYVMSSCHLDELVFLWEFDVSSAEAVP